MRTPRFRRGQIIKLGRLLNMLYRPAEIAEEIGITVDTVYRSYLPAGAPHNRDREGNVWINGTAFRTWAAEIIGTEKSNNPPMAEGLAWCMKCNKPVQIQNPRQKKTSKNLAFLQGGCPDCGTRVFRAVSLKRSTASQVGRKSAESSTPRIDAQEQEI